MFKKNPLEKLLGDKPSPGKKLFGVFSKIRRNHHAEQAVEKLINNSHLEPSFFVMCCLSGILATIGILLNDVAILIAAMVLAPLLNPVLAIAAAVTVHNRKLMAYALKSFVGGLFFVIFASAVLVFIWDWQGYTFDISPFAQRFSTADHVLFTAAFVSGFSGVYAWLRATDLSHLIGVAIAVSLVPFVSFFGVLFGLGEFDRMLIYLGAFTFNIAAIIVGAIVAFLYLGFSVKAQDIDHKIDKAQGGN